MSERLKVMIVLFSIVIALVSCSEQKRSISKVTLDGNLDEVIWENAIVFDTFYQNGGKSDKAEVQSQAYITADENFLYGAVVCFEPMMESIGAKTKKDGDMGDVYRDESIEFMLDADRDPNSYYHFIINANGAHAQQFKLESGRIISVWKSEMLWKSGAKKYDDKWIVEFAIPHSILSEEAKGICNNPNINFARNRHIGGIKESSILKNGTFHKGNDYIPIKLSAIDPGKYFMRIGQKQLAVRQGDNGDLIVNVNTNLINNGEKPITGEVNISFKNENGDTANKKKEITLKGGELQEVTLPVSLRKPGNYDIEITFAKNNSVTAMRQFPAEEIKFVPLTVVLDKPFYRNNFYHTEKADEIIAIIKSNLSNLNGMTFKLVMMKGEEKIADKSYTAKHGENAYKLPFSKELQVGDYRLIVSIIDTKGKDLANNSIAIKKLPKAPGTEVRVGKNLNIIMDGKPYFPIYWSSDFYGDPENDANDGSTGRLIGWGVNAKHHLDRLSSMGLYGTYSIMGSKDIAIYVKNKNDLTDEFKEYLGKIVEVAKDHPNMYGYEILDEPGGLVGLKDGFLTKIRNYIAEMDPYHPAIITNNTAAGFFTYASAQDISMPDPYPMFIEGGTSARGLDYQSYFLIDALKAGKGKKAIGICMQAFNYGDFTQKNGRAPSYVEFRSIFYNAAIRGAKIIYMWQYADDGARKYPQLKLGSPYFIKEAKALSMAIMLGKLIYESPIVKEGVDHRILEYKGDYFIIACNSGSKTIPVDVKLPEGCSATSLNTVSEGRVSVKGRVIVDTIAPFASKIYTTSNGFDDLPKLKEIKSVIEKGSGVYESDY